MKLRPLRFMNSNAVPRLSQEIFLRRMRSYAEINSVAVWYLVNF
eukprot:COSAG02_NODE_3294_length_6996_cov_21.108743_6_plen_44_part_00